MAQQRNFKWYRYTDNKGRTWAIRADAEQGDNATFGLAAFDSADPPFGPQSRRHAPRRAVYQDNTTFRTRVVVVGTAAAEAALPLTLNVSIPGDGATVTYNFAGNLPEKLQTAKASRNLADHA
jgi:hypothetical protein